LGQTNFIDAVNINSYQLVAQNLRVSDQSVLFTSRLILSGAVDGASS